MVSGRRPWTAGLLVALVRARANNEDSSSGRLQSRLDRFFRDEAWLVSASTGKFEATASCPSPAAHLFVTGHFRSMMWAKFSQAAMLERSSPRCWFVTAAVPTEIDAATSDPRRSHSSEKSRAGLENRSILEWNVPELMRETRDFFGGRMAYAVVNRSATIATTLGNAHFAFWHSLVWLISDWALREELGVPLDRHAMVLRSRPEMRFSRWFEWTGASRYLRAAASVRARHLIFGQEDAKNARHVLTQSDYMLATSYEVYERDVALPLLHGNQRDKCSPLDQSTRAFFRSMGLANSLGWGLSLQDGYNRLRDGKPVCGCLHPARDQGTTPCPHPSCFATVLNGFSQQLVSLRLSQFTSLQVWATDDNARLVASFDISKAAAYCTDTTGPVQGGSSDISGIWYIHTKTRKRRARILLNDTDISALEAEMWPANCSKTPMIADESLSLFNVSLAPSLQPLSRLCVTRHDARGSFMTTTKTVTNVVDAETT